LVVLDACDVHGISSHNLTSKISSNLALVSIKNQGTCHQNVARFHQIIACNDINSQRADLKCFAVIYSSN